MIVGLQIAHNARVEHSQGNESGGGPDVGPLGLSVISPIDMNFNMSVAAQRNSAQSYSVLGDFVFAYRIRKCFYHRGTGVGSIEPNHYNKRADLFN
jgi:hypothetical protein